MVKEMTALRPFTFLISLVTDQQNVCFKGHEHVEVNFGRPSVSAEAGCS